MVDFVQLPEQGTWCIMRCDQYPAEFSDQYGFYGLQPRRLVSEQRSAVASVMRRLR